jgi:hypothetical protein
MTDAQKLRYLAAWIAMRYSQYPYTDNTELQKDLLRIADKIEACGVTGCWMMDSNDGLLGPK